MVRSSLWLRTLQLILVAPEITCANDPTMCHRLGKCVEENGRSQCKCKVRFLIWFLFLRSIWFQIYQRTFGAHDEILKRFNLNKTDVVHSVSNILFVLFCGFWGKGIHKCIERIFRFSIWDQFNQFLFPLDAGLFIFHCIVVTMKSHKSRSLRSKSIDGCESIEENQDQCQFHFDILMIWFCGSKWICDEFKENLSPFIVTIHLISPPKQY